MARNCDVIFLMGLIIAHGVCKPGPSSNTEDIDIVESTTVSLRPAESSVNVPVWIIRFNSDYNDGKCLVKIRILGKGVNDYFEEYVPLDDDLRSAAKDHVMAIACIKRETGWYIDSWASIVVVKSNRCTKLVYETSNVQTKITSSPIGYSDCKVIRQKMVKFLMDHGNSMTPSLTKADALFAKGPPQPTPPLGSPSSPNEIWRDANEIINGRDWYNGNTVFHGKGWCHQELILQGRGVNDLFESSCLANRNNLQIVTVNEILAITDLGNDMGWYTDSWGILDIIQQGICYRRAYKTENGQTKITTSPVSSVKCIWVKQKLFYYINRYGNTEKPRLSIPVSPTSTQVSVPSSGSVAYGEPSNIVRWRIGNSRSKSSNWLFLYNTHHINGVCQQELTLMGRGVNDFFQDICILDDIRMYQMYNVLALGDLNKDFGWFSDTWGSLVAVKYGKCSKHTYDHSGGETKVSISTMSEDDCTTVKQSMNSYLGNFGKSLTSAAKTFETSLHLPSSPSVSGPLLSTFVAFRAGNERADSDKWAIVLNKLNINGRCEQELTVLGKGVNDYFTDSCLHSDDTKFVIGEKVLALGDPEKESGLYSDTWGTLVIVKDGQCAKRTYETMKGQTKVTSSLITDNDCYNAKQKMTHVLRERGVSERSLRPDSNGVVTTSDQPVGVPMVLWRAANDRSTNINWAFMFNTHYNQGACQQELTLMGRGVNDLFIDPCTLDPAAVKVVANNFLAIGDPNRNSGWFTDTWASLIVIINGRCFKRDYGAVVGETKITSTPMNDNDCVAVKKTMKNLLETSGESIKTSIIKPTASLTKKPTTVSLLTPGKTYRPANNKMGLNIWSNVINLMYTNGECKQQMTFLGRGVNDYFHVPCDASEDIRIAAVDNVLAVGDNNRLADSGWFTDTWGTMVVIQNGKCAKRKYKNTNGQTEITSTSMADTECTKAKEKMLRTIKNQGLRWIPSAPLVEANKPKNIDTIKPTSSPKITWLEATDAVKYVRYSVIRNRNEVNGRCDWEEFKIIGRGVNDLFREFCLPKNEIRIAKPGNTLIIADRKINLAFFSEAWSLLIVVKGNECEKRMYETGKGRTKITSWAMGSDECSLMKVKISNKLQKLTSEPSRRRRFMAKYWA